MTEFDGGQIPEKPEIDPLTSFLECLKWIELYLLPKSMGGHGFRAHQFTINGLTYPFVRHYNFAAVPDPPGSRRYDMYSGLHLARPGDLLFFFQADPQAPGGDIDSRRGIRGVFRVKGFPYRVQRPFIDTISGVGYQILDKCPSCGDQHSTFSPKCPGCGGLYPTTRIGEEDINVRVLSSHLDIEPLFLFERSVSDERAYADFSDPGIIWIGRHDNAMGAGKGSSIRHLLPEEAMKLVRLLAGEPGQSMGTPSRLIPSSGLPLTHATGQPIEELPTDENGYVKREDELYFLITEQLFISASPLQRALLALSPHGTTWDDLEYASSTFPWGYTAGAADYVLIFRNNSGRKVLFIIECKTGRAHDEAVLQVLLYGERVLQVAFLSPPQGAIPRSDQAVEIIPVIIAEDVRRIRSGNAKIAIPASYSFTRSYFGGPTITAHVNSPTFLKYLPPPPGAQTTTNFRAVTGFKFETIPLHLKGVISWIPDAGSVGTGTEINWILKTSWAAARRNAGL